MTVSRRSFLAASAGGLALASLTGPSALAGLARRSTEGRVFTWNRLRGGAMATASLTSGGNVLVVPFTGGSGSGGLLVDTKFAGIASVLRDEVVEILGEGVPLTLVVNTHHHGDHTGGNLAFQGAEQIVAHTNAAPRIAAQTDRYIDQLRAGPKLLEQINPDAPAKAVLEVDRAARGADDHRAEDWTPTTALAVTSPTVFEMGASKMVLHHFGAGHTDNDLVVHIEDLNIVHTGDLLFHRLHPFMDRPAGATSKGWIESVRQIIKLCDDKTLVIPGHGPITGVAGLRGQIEYFEAVRDAAQRAIDAGETRDEFAASELAVFEGYSFEGLKSRTLGTIYDEISEE